MSKFSEGWWDYTTLEPELLADAAALTVRDVEQLSRPGFTVHFHDTVEDFYLAEALEYITAWRQATPDNPVGICGPIGPTEQLPLAARLVNAIGLNLRDAHFWGMDEWVVDGKPVGEAHPLSFARCDREMCFDRVERTLKMPSENIHFPNRDLAAYSDTFGSVRCAVMQGGQGEIKHWAFNDPLPRKGAYQHSPPSVDEYRALRTRVVQLHPVTLMQNARMSCGGNIAAVPTHAATVGPYETWQADEVSIWHPGNHDNPFGIRLTALMIAKGMRDSSVPISLLADHPNVSFHYLRPGFSDVTLDIAHAAREPGEP
jgi:glucosamine-6-phosphate deaminase